MMMYNTDIPKAAKDAPPEVRWSNCQSVSAKRYLCGYCNNRVSSEKGWEARETRRDGHRIKICVCPDCGNPTYFRAADQQIPGNLPGASVEHLPEGINRLYTEARECASVSAYTAAVMICRKMLMNIAVSKGAKTGQNFIQYVAYLSNKGHVSTDNKEWVKHIRDKGNEANHEIKPMTKKDAEYLIEFLAVLLRTIYEFPGILAESRQNEESE